MEPIYMNMHSYPHQNGQMRYRPCCYPGMEARPPMSYECRPWGSSCGYAPPGACRGCSNHAYIPPHFAYSQIPPHYCPGNYPYFPAQYIPPPPYNVMEHPRYEYEKNVPMEHHCCGCHNHPLHQKEQRNVRIEEEEPEQEKREDNSIVPSQFNNSPYPIVWLPPDHKEFGKVKNKEGGEDASGDVKKDHDNRTLWNGWLPLHLKNAVSSKQRGDGDENSRQGDEMRNFQFPFFWMPYKPDEGRENQKVENSNAKQSLETGKGSDGGQNFDVNRGIAGEKSVPKVKDIPVKEVGQHVAQESARIQENEGDTSAKNRSGNGEKKIHNVESLSAKEGSEGKSSSPRKSSKLPPVCLRVDPLPRKKSANAKSRSPSPPGDKQKLEVKSNEAVKVRSSENEEQVKEGMDKKTIAVVDGNTSPEECMNVLVETSGKLPSNSQDDVLTKQAEGRPEDGTAQKHGETGPVKQETLQDIVSAGGEKELFGDEEMKTGAAKKHSKGDLSEEEAAAIIQSAYRGYDVRRWEPLKKLKEIARVREQIADVRRLIQEMESSSNIEGRPKQKTIIAETIMSLLLRLDIIQGLLPSVREIRKSAVRELVCLQEQLDTIMNGSSEKPPEQECMMRNGRKDASSKCQDVMLSENSLIDGVSNPERAEFSEGNPIDEAASSENIGIEAAGRSVDGGVESTQGLTIKDGDDNSSMKLENNESSYAKEDREAILLGLGSEVDDSADCEPTDDQDSLQGELAELPRGLVDDTCGEDGMNRSAVKSDSITGDHSKQLEEAAIGSPIVQESANEENHQTMETHEASDLQLNGADVETKETGKGGSLDNCNLEFKSVPLEEVHSNIKDTTSEPSECRDEQPENFIADRNETSEASDDREFPATGACIEKIPTNDKPFESPWIADSVMEEPPRSQNMEEIGLIDESRNSYDAKSTAADNFNDRNDICSVEEATADANHTEGVSEMGSLSKEREECNMEHPEATEKQELEDEESNAVESNRKLMEENERLREMMEKLIKSGHEQLTAISSLSGRVKDLERRLSRKKKLKFRGPRASCITKVDGPVTM